MSKSRTSRFDYLCDYINTIRVLEEQRYILENSIEEIEYTIDHLAVPSDISPPQKQEVNEMGFLGAAVMGVILFAVSCIIGALLNAMLGWLFSGIFPIFLITGIILGVFCFIKIGGESAGRINACEEEYEQQYERYQEELEIEEIRIREEEKMCEFYDDQLDYLISAQNDTVDLLEKLYSKNIIYEKYQYDLVAICSFAEYLASGRCDELTGHEGAYNLYEHELRMHIITSKLDEIIERLDELAATQYTICESLIRIEEQQYNIVNNLNDIANNQIEMIHNQKKTLRQTEAINYNTTVMRRNSEIAMLYL